jgi:hypothetical protein
LPEITLLDPGSAQSQIAIILGDADVGLVDFLQDETATLIREGGPSSRWLAGFDIPAPHV